MTTRRGFLAALLALPVVAKAVWSIAPPMFDGKTMRLRVGQTALGPHGVRVSLLPPREGSPCAVVRLEDIPNPRLSVFIRELEVDAECMRMVFA